MSKLKNTFGFSFIQKENGFTMTKTFVVVIVMSALITLALARFLPHVDFTRSAEAVTVTPVGLKITATRTNRNGGNVGDKVVVFYSDMGTTRSGTGAFKSIK
ncbi:MAG: type II secretion system protein [Candidatus Omnitrophica bacterium]|nr:type II secretion system protein [Candidatus Omnitrophota bacterium]